MENTIQNCRELIKLYCRRYDYTIPQALTAIRKDLKAVAQQLIEKGG